MIISLKSFIPAPSGKRPSRATKTLQIATVISLLFQFKIIKELAVKKNNKEYDRLYLLT